MQPFDSLLDVAEKLLGPHGCPWDQKQTFTTLQPYVLEEAHEVIEAVDAGDDDKIVEELGDLLYTIIFYGKLAEKTNRFSMADIINTVKEKLIRRHPHVFGDVEVRGEEDVVRNWEKIKSEEKKEAKQLGLLEGIPPTTPLILKTQKILKKLQRQESPLAPKDTPRIASEEALGDQLLALILQAENSGIDAESALRRSLSRLLPS